MDSSEVLFKLLRIALGAEAARAGVSAGAGRESLAGEAGRSEDPTLPENPGQSEDLTLPENTGGSEDLTLPENPGGSENPTQPESLGQSENPTQPETPSRSENPTLPENPTQSENLAQSANLTQPEDPTLLEDPTQSENLAQSANLTQPENPTLPENPSQSEDSTLPENPGRSEDPTLPANLTQSEDLTLPEDVPWREVIDLSFAQGVAAIAIDGLQKIYDNNPGLELTLDAPEFEDDKYEWFAEVMSSEADYSRRDAVTRKILGIWRAAGIEAIVLKGASYSRLYPVPAHRYSCDLDLLPLSDWDRSNALLEEAGYSVDRRQKKHSLVDVYGVHVENHQYLCATKGNREGKRFDAAMKALIAEGKLNEFNLLFYLKHAQGHFLVENGIQLKHILDWVVLRNLRSEETDRLVRDFGLEGMQKAIDDVAGVVMGEKTDEMCPVGRKMFEDIMAERKPNAHRKSRFVSHINIILTIWRRRKLFRDFADFSAPKLIWMYVWGFITE